MTDAPTHRVDRDGAVATVTLDRPDALNAQTRASRRALLHDLRELAADESVRCVVLTGAGRAFCAGQDLREPGALENVDEVIRETYIPIVETLVGMPKPVVAAINGAAAGAGLSLALACDVRYLAEGAVLMMAFSNIALVPDCGGSWLLPRTVGYARAFELAASGRRVGAEEALALGLVQRVLPADEVLPAAQATAGELAARPTLALGGRSGSCAKPSRAPSRTSWSSRRSCRRRRYARAITRKASRRSSRSARRASRDADAVPRPRLRLIVNPVASGVKDRSVRSVLQALEPLCDVEMVATERRGHAIELAAEAIAGGFDGIASMGGDGTANEVLNGAGAALPIGALPAGGTSVLPRTLGLPRGIGAAATRVGEALVAGRERSINLGVVNGRRFAFASGVGADAQAVRLVDGAGRARGRRPGDAYFAAQIMRTLLRGDFRDPLLEVLLEDEVVAHGGSIFVANVHPWSYVGPFALKLAPRATFEGGLDVVVPSDMRRRHLPRYATQLLVTGSQAYREDRLLAYLHDVDEVRVVCSRPLPLHADGDDLGDVEEAVFGVARDAARMLV